MSPRAFPRIEDNSLYSLMTLERSRSQTLDSCFHMHSSKLVLLCKISGVTAKQMFFKDLSDMMLLVETELSVYLVSISASIFSRSTLS